MKQILIHFNLSNLSPTWGLDFLTNILTKRHISWVFLPSHLNASSNLCLPDIEHMKTSPKNCVFITDQADQAYLTSIKNSGIQKLILLDPAHTLQKNHSIPVDQVITNFYDFYQKNFYSLLL